MPVHAAAQPLTLPVPSGDPIRARQGREGRSDLRSRWHSRRVLFLTRVRSLLLSRVPHGWGEEVGPPHAVTARRVARMGPSQHSF